MIIKFKATLSFERYYELDEADYPGQSILQISQSLDDYLHSNPDDFYEEDDGTIKVEFESASVSKNEDLGKGLI